MGDRCMSRETQAILAGHLKPGDVAQLMVAAGKTVFYDSWW